MQTIHKKQLITCHQLIKYHVFKFDPQAEIYLFGSGSQNIKRQVDIYIFSEVIEKQHIPLLKTHFEQCCLNNVQDIFVSNNKDKSDHIKMISVKI